MNMFNNKIDGIEQKENVLLGIIGAFLFSLVGGVLYIVLSWVGFIAAISGFVAVFCAIKGYSFFGKKESKKGVIISVIVSAIVLVIAWYLGFCIDMINAYEEALKAQGLKFDIGFFEYLTKYSFEDLKINPEAFVNLAMSLGLGIVGCFSYVKGLLKPRTTVPPAVAPAPENNENNTPEA